jgi:hypothetical protein
MAVYNPAAVQPLQGLPVDAESCPGMIGPISFEAKQTESVMLENGTLRCATSEGWHVL